MISEQLGHYIEGAGVKRSHVAAAAGMDEGSLVAALSGRRSFSADEYVAICDYLRIPYSALLDAGAYA